MAKRILVSIDGSATSRRALAQALGEAKAHKAALRIVHVIDELTPGRGHPGSLAEFWQIARANGRKVLDDARAQARADGIRADTVMHEIREIGSLVRHVPEAILAEARRFRADLVVIGTHGRRGISRLLLGSVAEAVLRASRVPVLLVPHGSRTGGRALR